jgi:hypothetical protein
MHSSDVYATLLNATGAALPAGTDGVDQWAAIAAGSASSRFIVLISKGPGPCMLPRKIPR